MFYFRADANSIIGSGHVMRCLSIADAMRSIGCNSTFITADHEAETLITSRGYGLICMDTQWDDLESEVGKLTELIRNHGIEQLVIDSYYVTEEYLNSIRLNTRIIYMDDLNRFRYPVDVLINYNIYALNIPYHQMYKNNTRLLLGCSYTPLRAEFVGKHFEIRDQVRDILVSTGGSDPLNMAGKLMRYVNNTGKFADINFHIVVGSFNRNKVTLADLAEKYINIQLHYQVSEMSELMTACDLAISAGGSTLYELCACGIPSISYSFADNQLEGVREFHRQDIIKYAGDIRWEEELCLQEIEASLSQMSSDTQLRRKLSAHMQSLVDGLGAVRIIQQIL